MLKMSFVRSGALGRVGKKMNSEHHPHLENTFSSMDQDTESTQCSLNIFARLIKRYKLFYRVARAFG